MSVALFACPVCGQALSPTLANTGEFWDCSRCGTGLRVDVFPAHQRDPLAARQAHPIASEDEAACFNHPGFRAERACQHCGRLICATCSTPISGTVLCPACVVQSVGGDPRKIGLREYNRFDRPALVFALVSLIPMLGLIFSLIAGFLLGIQYAAGGPPIGQSATTRRLTVFLTVLGLLISLLFIGGALSGF